MLDHLAFLFYLKELPAFYMMLLGGQASFSLKVEDE